LVVLALVAMVLAIVNAVLHSANRALQAQANERQLFVQQTVQLEGLYQQLIRGLAEVSARANDGQLAAVLAKHGITVTYTPQPAATPAPAPAPSPSRK
jgi:type II secretory pathway component PulK